MNIQKLKEQQKHLDFHPKFWEKEDIEIMATIINAYSSHEKTVCMLSGIENPSKAQYDLLAAVKKQMEIINSAR